MKLVYVGLHVGDTQLSDSHPHRSAIALLRAYDDSNAAIVTVSPDLKNNGPCNEAIYSITQHLLFTKR